MNHLIVGSFLLFDFVLLSIPAYSQRPHQNGDSRPIKLETELVLIDAEVLDRKTGAPVKAW